MFASPNEIKLGSKVKDSVTGFVGIATYSAEYLTGTVHICVQPTCADPSVMVEGQMMDWQRLDFIDAGVSERYSNAAETSLASCNIVLGKEYRNLANNFTGIAKIKFVSLNGCIQIQLESIQPEGTSSDRLTGTAVLESDYKELVLVSEGVAGKVIPESTGAIRGARKSKFMR